MKKTILILVVLTLLVPAAAFAATEFSLGGFIKLDGFWDSTQEGKNMNTAIGRNNNPQFQHGRFQETAQGSRFNFTIKGPNLWGATTTGFIEIDFDQVNEPVQNASHAFTPRLRHAMFRLNWPETELLFGQYWSFMNEFAPESAQDGGFQFHGQPTHRLPQIRLTQKFLGDWTVAGMVAKPTDPALANDAVFDASTLGVAGQSSETPQLEGKIGYEKDLWGKAPFYGRPRGFVAQIEGGWQRTRYQSGIAAANTFSQNAFSNAFGMIQRDQQYLDPWVAQLNLFIPVLPTYSNNLAGSASISAQWYVGQGLAAFGNGRDADQTWFRFMGGGFLPNTAVGLPLYDRQLTKAFGGYVQGQYWFTNQWFMNLAWGFQRQYGFDTSISPNAITGANTVGYKYATIADQVKMWNEIDLTLWYRPIEAVKFGLQYSYGRTDYLQKVNNPAVSNANGNGGNPGQNAQPSAGAKNFGEAHRVEFVAFLFF